MEGELYHTFADTMGRKTEKLPQFIHPVLLRGWITNALPSTLVYGQTPPFSLTNPYWLGKLFRIYPHMFDFTPNRFKDEYWSMFETYQSSFNLLGLKCEWMWRLDHGFSSIYILSLCPHGHEYNKSFAFLYIFNEGPWTYCYPSGKCHYEWMESHTYIC